MADLSNAQVVTRQKPFHGTGVDLMGPLLVKQGRNNIKHYIIIFTCLATRAVHLKIPQSLETNSFIQSFQ